MKYKKIYEFLVWDNCNNNCKFCWQRKEPRLFNREKRELVLNEVLSFIRSNQFEFGSHILVCGGEIFDKLSDFDNLDTFFVEVLQMMVEGRIDLLYLNTNLIYKDLTGVCRLLERVKSLKLFDRLRFTTSYDIAGRFKSEEDRQLMLSNLRLLTGVYKDLQVVTNIILTKQACQSIISKELKLSNFMQEYRCWVNLIPYIILEEELAPDRCLVFEALLTVNEDVPNYLSKYVPNMNITQEKWLYMYKDNQWKFCSCSWDDCGHPHNFKKYSKEGSCFGCDLEEIFNETL